MKFRRSRSRWGRSKSSPRGLRASRKWASRKWVSRNRPSRLRVDVRQFRSCRPHRVSDASGVGPRARLPIDGVVARYPSDLVSRGSRLELPCAEGTFERALCLPVLEHLPLADQSRALAELFRVISAGGELFVTVPNLAHLQSRIHF